MEMGSFSMKIETLKDTAKALIADGKGLLAIDESTPTCNRRFLKLGIPQTAESRRDYREMLITTPDLAKSISGAILYNETAHQREKSGNTFTQAITDQGIILGIKVDAGTKDLPGYFGERLTGGLDGLADRLKVYCEMGFRFAKWRAVFEIGTARPSVVCIEVNAKALARYAFLCQQNGLVPVVEPEVLMDGDHPIERCAEVTEEVLRGVFCQLNEQGVALEGLILKCNMVLPGLKCPRQATPDEVADATVKCLLRAVPAAVPAVAFLSGGQSGELASARLNAMNVRFKTGLPWALTFSFGRGLQEPALTLWHGDASHVLEAQRALDHRARCNRAARLGQYSSAMESQSGKESIH